MKIVVSVLLLTATVASAQPVPVFDKLPPPKFGKPPDVPETLPVPVAEERIAYGPPWLPEAEQIKLRALWPKGVPIPKNLKFYDIPRMYQRRVVLNNQPTVTIHPVDDSSDNINLRHPWRVSGGLHASPAEQWLSAKALALPGPIQVWQEMAPAPLTGPLVPLWRWRFPDGTVAVDMLIKRNADGTGHCFELREQEKINGAWDAGTAYRPDLTGEEVFISYRNDVPNEFVGTTLESRTTEYRALVIRPRSIFDLVFKPTRKVVVDGGVHFPANYAGTGVSCATCHAKAGDGTGYGVAVRGDDGRFWHPFDAAGQVDRRWPLAFTGMPTARQERIVDEGFFQSDFGSARSFAPARGPFRRR